MDLQEIYSWVPPLWGDVTTWNHLHVILVLNIKQPEVSGYFITHQWRSESRMGREKNHVPSSNFVVMSLDDLNNGRRWGSSLLLLFLLVHSCILRRTRWGMLVKLLGNYFSIKLQSAKNSLPLDGPRIISSPSSPAKPSLDLISFDPRINGKWRHYSIAHH